MKKTVILFSLFLMIFPGCSKVNIIELPITTSSPKALEYYKKAMLSYQVGDGPEKRALLDSALSIDPNFTMALEFYDSQDPIIKRKHRELAKKNVVDASEAEKKILTIRESYRKEDMDKALESARWLVENHKESYESFIWLGQVQSDRYELDEAIITLKKAIELNPDSYDAYRLLMGHHISAGTQVMLPQERRDVDLGMKYGDELIRIRSDQGAPYHLKANCYRQLGEFEKAKPLYEKSIKNRKGLSSEGTAYIVSAHNYMFSGDLITARKSYEKAIEINKEKANEWFFLNLYLTYSYIFDNDYMGAIDRLLSVENQLEKSNHDHLGKIITYLTSIGAKTAIWIVANARPEHVNAINWLNEASSADFYLVKLEAIKIGDSPAAPLFTLLPLKWKDTAPLVSASALLIRMPLLKVTRS